MSLKKKITKEIETKFPKIFNSKNNKIYNLKAFVFRENFGIIFLAYSIIILVIILYSKFLDFSFLKILKINFEDNIKVFTTGVITLVSMNLFVTNLLLTHLKEERDDIQSIIDRKVNFKFITYLGFTIIICVLCIYFFSYSINNTIVNSNILIFIFSSFIFYIFLLVNLYTTVFNFIHKTKREEIIKSELNLEFYKAFYVEYFERRFYEEYRSLMENKLNIQSYPIFRRFDKVHHCAYKAKKNVYLKDINLNEISILEKEKNNEEKYYHLLKLDKQYQKDSEINLFSSFKKINCRYNRIFSFSTKRQFHTEYSQEYLDKLLQRINDNTLSNKYQELSKNLKNLEDIYAEYIELENET